MTSKNCDGCRSNWDCTYQIQKPFIQISG